MKTEKELREIWDWNPWLEKHSFAMNEFKLSQDEASKVADKPFKKLDLKYKIMLANYLEK